MNGGIELETSPTEATATLDGGGEAILAMDPARGVRITSADDTDSMSFSLPGASGLDDAAVAGDGSLNYVGDATTPSINLMTGTESIRVSVVIDNAAQADRFDYNFGPDATVEIQDDGSAIAYVVESTTDPATEVRPRPRRSSPTSMPPGPRTPTVSRFRPTTRRPGRS
ncbi:hypothetical protein JM654_23550 [Microbacterium oxydans]|nr:hypothetical protein [Microbacterium oxydans]